MPRRPPTVYLHVGPPKTGTTFLQEVLWRNERALAAQRFAFPRRPMDHFRAALDLRKIDFGGYQDPETVGAWERLAAEALGCGKESVVISHEVLAAASPEQIATALASLAPAEAHVVYGARDLARQLPAVWQESLKNRRTRPYKKFLKAALKRRGQRDVRTAGFWSAQDPVQVLARWAEQVPAERIHVITLPQQSTGQTLWRRFCTAVGLDPEGFDLEVARSNVSLTQSEAEVLRRLNAALPDDLDWPAYERLVKRRFNKLAERSASNGERIRVPRRYRSAVLRRADEICGALQASPYDIVGDLDELIPLDEGFGPVRGMRPDTVADAAVALLAEVLTEAPRSNSFQGVRWIRRLRSKAQ